MIRILNYELKSLSLGKNMIKLLLGVLLLSLVYLAFALANNIPDAISALGDGLAFYSSIIVFIAPIFAGLFLSQSFENRMIQNNIMTGHKRSSVILGKSLYFLLLLVMFLFIPTLLSTGVVAVIKGWNTTSQTLPLINLVIQAVLFILLVSSAYMINIPIAFHFKKTGPTIGMGLLVSILLYSLTQQLIQNETLQSILEYTPLGNSYFVFNEQGFGLLKSLVIIIIWTILCVLVTWINFRKDELK